MLNLLLHQVIFEFYNTNTINRSNW